MVVRVFQIVDELGKVFNRIDVVVRRRRNQFYPRRRVTHRGDPRVDFSAGQLTALTGLGTLRHFNLKFLCIYQIVARDPESTGGDLLNRAVFGVAVGFEKIPRRILSPFTGIALSANPVHRNCQCLVCLLTDGTVGHRPTLETFANFFNRFYLVDRNRFIGELQFQKPTQRCHILSVIINQLRIVFIDIIVIGAGCQLQLMNRRWVEQMIFAILSPLEMSADIQGAIVNRDFWEGCAVTHQGFASDNIKSNPFHASLCPGKVTVNNLLFNADGFKDLCTSIRLDG